MARINEILSKTQGVMRLHLLLMLNAGLTQKDISDLSPAEYVNGRIERVAQRLSQEGHKKGVVEALGLHAAVA